MSKPESKSDEELDVSDTVVAPGQQIPGNGSGSHVQPENRGPGQAKRDRTPATRLARLGDYLLGRELGRGGMGVVYEATEVSLQRRVAVKVLPQSSRLDKIQALRFANESRAAAQLNHPNIVPVYAVGEEDGVDYFVMRLIEGQNLSQLIKSVRHQLSTNNHEARNATPQPHNVSTVELQPGGGPEPSSGPRSDHRKPERMEFKATDFARTRSARRYATTRRIANKVARIGVLVADALQHAHEAGIVHRDIKPCNLMLDNSGVVWVTDFGLAQIKDTPTLTKTGVLLGTMRYMSPEQAAGMRALIDQRTDIYSLGVSLCEMLTLQHVVSGKSTQQILKDVVYGAPINIRRVDPSVPGDLAVILEKAMSKSPQDRYSTAAEMADDLTCFLNNEPIRAKRPPLWKRGQQWAERNRAIAATLIAAFLVTFLMTVAAAGVVWNALLQEKEQRARTEVALTESEGLRLLANAALQLPENPGLSLALAIEGAQAAPGIEADSTLMAAMDANHEYATIAPGDHHPRGHVAVSSDGTKVVISSGETGDPTKSIPALVYSMKDGKTLWALDDGRCVVSAAFSPSGRHVLTTSTTVPENAAQQTTPTWSAVMWDAGTGEKLFELGDVTNQLAHPNLFAPDGNHVLVARGNELLVQELANRENILILRGHKGQIGHTEFSPDGKRILTASDDGTVSVWNSNDGTRTRPDITWHAGSLRQIHAAFTADSEYLAISDQQGVKLFRVNAAADQDAEIVASRRELYMVVNRDHSQLGLLNLANNTVLLVSSQTLEAICELQLPARPQRVVFHPRQKQILVSCGAQLFLFHSESGELLGKLFGHDFEVSDIAFNPVAQSVASVSDSTLRLWHTTSGAVRSAIRPNDPASERLYNPTAVAVSTAVATASGRHFQTNFHGLDGTVMPGEFPGKVARKFCDSEKLVTIVGRTIYVHQASTSRRLFEGEFSEQVLTDSRLVAGGTKLLVRTLGNVFIVDLATGSRVRLGDRNDSIRAFAALPDGRNILLGTSGGQCVYLDSETLKEAWSREHATSVLSIDIRPDGDRYLTTEISGRVKIYTFDDESPVIEFDVPGNHQSIFAGESGFLLNWSLRETGPIECRDSDNGQLISQLPTSGRIQLACHPDQPLVAVSAGDGAKIWNLESGQTQTLTAAPCTGVAIVDDRVAVITGPTSESADRKFQIYSLSDHQLIHESELKLAGWSVAVDRQRSVFVTSQHGYIAEFSRANDSLFLAQTEPIPDRIVFLELLHTGGLVAVSSSGKVQLSDAEGKTTGSFPLPDDAVVTAALTPDQKLLVTSHSSGLLVVSALQDLAAVSRLPGHSGPAKTLRFDRNGNYLVSTSSEDAVRYWDLRTQRAKEFAVAGAAQSEISPDGAYLLVVTQRDETGRQHAILVNTTDDSISDLTQEQGTRQAQFSPDGDKFALLESNGALEIFDLPSGKLHCRIQKQPRMTTRFAFTKNSEVMTDHSVQLQLWRIPEAELIWRRDNIARSSRQTGGTPWRPVTDDGQWILSDDGRKYPREVLLQAQNDAPRQLTKKERQQFQLDLADVLKEAKE